MPFGNFKEAELYDLDGDFGEKDDVADEHGEIVARLIGEN